MTSFATLRSLVLTSLGKTGDAEATTLVDAVINYAMFMAALIFDPPELKVINDITLAGGIDYIYFPNLIEGVDFNETDFIGIWEIDENGDLMPVEGITLNTRLLDIIKVYNKTDSYKMDFIPYESWDLAIPDSNVIVKYYTLFGNRMFIKAVPLANKTISISHTTYPTKLVLDVDELPFDHHDSYITSIASGIAFAVYEETESADLWNKIATLVGEPNVLGQRARDIIEGQKVLLESTISQVRGA